MFRYNSLEYAGLPGERWIPVPLPPPGTLVLAEISWLLPNGPELAGSAVRVPVSTETDDGHRAVSAELSLGSESRFPERRSSQAEARFDWKVTARPVQACGVDATIRRGGRRGGPLPFRGGVVHRWLP